MQFDFKKLESNDPKEKYGYAKYLLINSKETPEILYDYFEVFAGLLDSKNNILLWTAIDIVGNLSVVDNQNKVDEQIPKIVDFLNCGKLITVNHSIYSLGEIAKNKIKYNDFIVNELLKVQNYNFETEECKNIAIGKVLETFKLFFDFIKNNTDVIKFIDKQTKNTRNSTKKKAENLIKKITKSNK